MQTLKGKKLLIILVAAMALTLVLSGCGASGQDQTEDPKSDPIRIGVFN